MVRRVKDIMARAPEVIHVDLPLGEAAGRMKKADIGALFVVDGDELVGVITDRDLVVRGMTANVDPGSAAVIETMTKHVVFCHENDSIAKAADLTTRQQVRRLAVVDDARELVGVVSLADLAMLDGADGIGAARALRVISRPIGTAKRPAREDPTGGRARGSDAGILHVYAQRPRIRRRPPSPAGRL
jgi:CBS domain-containing protein